MTLTEAKERVNIRGLWQHFGLEGQPSKSCRCPFHQDRNNSFSVSPDGVLFNCFAGCGGGDAVDFLALATRLPKAAVCREFIRLAGGSPSVATPRLILPKFEETNENTEKATQRKGWPVFESPLTGEDDTAFRAMNALAKLRHISPEGVRLAAERTLLHFAAWKGKPAWIVTDGKRVNAQARRMDGKLWEGINAKAQTLPGSQAAWPVGLGEAQPFHTCLLCEGGPDLLAAHHFIHAHKREADTAAVAMLGASNRIPAEALPLFAGKRIRIMAHADKKGNEAAALWAEQLEGVGATVDASDFSGLIMADGSPVKDLNDLCYLNPNSTNDLKGLIPQ